MIAKEQATLSLDLEGIWLAKNILGFSGPFRAACPVQVQLLRYKAGHFFSKQKSRGHS